MKRTIPALILGLWGLALSPASSADSSFSITLSSGYIAPIVTHIHADRVRACPPYRRPPVHVDTYIEKRVYNYPRHERVHEYREYREYEEYHEYRDRRHHRRDRHQRHHHSGYARAGYY